MDWQKVFSITRLCYLSRLCSLHFTITVAKNIVNDNKDFVIQRFIIVRFHCINITYTVASAEDDHINNKVH